jgi:hypothetical protein
MMNLLKQPLTHFLLVGVVIFAAYQFSDQPVEESVLNDKVINVDRTSLLNFMQFRAQAFQPELFSQQLDALDDAGRQRLIDDFVREEAMYREALAMGMDQGDYIIRQRLVQKVEFLLENLVNQALEANEDTIQAFYESHRDDYQVDSVYTFTHIFFDGDERGWDEAKNQALALLDSPAIADTGFNDAGLHGDRYPFLQNYVDRTRDFVVNNFNEDFVVALDGYTPGDANWYGPLQSRYGWHLVMLLRRSDPYIPALDDIRERVIDDWRYETALDNRREAEDRVVDDYEVRVAL